MLYLGILGNFMPIFLIFDSQKFIMQELHSLKLEEKDRMGWNPSSRISSIA